MTSIRQGDIWWAEGEGRRRPVLVLTRSGATPILTWILVAPVTRSIRPIPTHLALGPEEGLPTPSAATFGNILAIRRAFLTTRIGALDGMRRPELCAALLAVADC